jgi:uncharacterized membrane protein HdeD (DUF308 family)
MAKALAVLLVAIGAILLISFFVQKIRAPFSSAKFAIGLFMAALGIWIFLNPNTFTDFIPRLFGVFILASGIMNLGHSFSLIKYHYKLWWISLILALINIGFGCFLIFRSTMAAEMITQVCGCFLIFVGASNLWTLSRVSKFARQAQQIIKDAEAIDAEASVIDEDK